MLHVDLVGADTFIIVNADTVMETPSAELMAQIFPNVPLDRQVAGHPTLLSIEKARRILGYEPEHSWRNRLSQHGQSTLQLARAIRRARG